MADEFPAWPVSVPPQPKCASSTGFEALRYAICFNGPGADEPEEGDCDVGWAAAPQIIAATTTAKRLLRLMPPPSLIVVVPGNHQAGCRCPARLWLRRRVGGGLSDVNLLARVGQDHVGFLGHADIRRAALHFPADERDLVRSEEHT